MASVEFIGYTVLESSDGLSPSGVEITYKTNISYSETDGKSFLLTIRRDEQYEPTGETYRIEREYTDPLVVGFGEKTKKFVDSWCGFNDYAVEYTLVLKIDNGVVASDSFAIEGEEKAALLKTDHGEIVGKDGNVFKIAYNASEQVNRSRDCEIVSYQNAKYPVAYVMSGNSDRRSMSCAVLDRKSYDLLNRIVETPAIYKSYSGEVFPCVVTGMSFKKEVGFYGTASFEVVRVNG